jgi:predicted  nucleic acid-binding Zn-ribbon protein
MNIFNTSPQRHTESTVTNEENNLEETQTQIETIDKRLLEIAAENRKLEEDIAHTEKNDGSYPQDAQVAGRLRGLRNMRDELAVEKGKLLTEKNETLAQKYNLPIKENATERPPEGQQLNSANDDNISNAFDGSNDDRMHLRHEAMERARRGVSS